MVGGRLYGEVSRSRRAASVPVGDFSPPLDANISHHARVISSHAVQDTEALRAASKQHDINFLNDISNKLAAAQQPTRYYRETTPVYIGNKYPPPTNHSTVSDYRRRTLSYADPQATDYEVSSYLSGGPQAYRSGFRGVSVPPPRGPSVPRWHAPSPSRTFREGSASRGYSREKLAPYEDVVVGVAHTSLYGDIVIGIPYHKRHMFDLDGNELGSSAYKAPSNGARHSIANNYRNIGTVVTPPSSRRGSISGPSYRRSSVSVPSNRRVLYDDVDEYLSSTPRYRSSGNSGYSSDYPSGRPPLPGRASSVQRHVDGPDYSSYSSYPPRSSNPAPVYSSSVTIPYLSSGSYPSSTSSMPPIPPKTYNRPPVSEARRKVRDLLCKSKNDPKYFEGY